MKKSILTSAVMTVFFLSVLLLQITGCKKDEDDCPIPIYPVTGLWEGTYQTNQVNHSPTYASMTIYPDGSILRKSKITGTVNEYAYFKGRWTLNGNTFQFRDTTFFYPGSPNVVIDTGTLTFQNDGTFSNGTWQDVSGQPYTGTFQNMRRVN